MAVAAHTLEIWKPIPFAPGYFVSNHGRVKGRRGSILSPFTNRGGYHIHTFYIAGKYVKKTTHYVVCTVFNGPRPDNRKHCAHADGNKLNNRPENLRWATAKENAADGLRLGKYKYGDDHWTHQHPERMQRGDNHHMRRRPDRVRRGNQVYNACLTDEQARAIRSAEVKKGDIKRLAERFGVSTHVIADIRRGRTYRHAYC